MNILPWNCYSLNLNHNFSKETTSFYMNLAPWLSIINITAMFVDSLTLV